MTRSIGWPGPGRTRRTYAAAEAVHAALVRRSMRSRSGRGDAPALRALSETATRRDRRRQEIAALEDVAARLRVGGLAPTPEPSLAFRSKLEARLSRAWPEGLPGGGESSRPNRRWRPGSMPSLAGAALAIVLAMGSLSQSSRALLVAPTLTPTADITHATPSPASSSLGTEPGRREGASRVPVDRGHLVAQALRPSSGEAVAAPSPRSTPTIPQFGG